MKEFPYTINDLRRAVQDDHIAWKTHAVKRLQERNILQSEVIECVLHGEFIEMYQEDKPFASCLILGATNNVRHLHIVCSYAEQTIYIITAYEPDMDRWDADLKKRKKEL